MASKNDAEDIVKQIMNVFKKGSGSKKVTKKKYSQSSSTKNTKNTTKKPSNIPQDEDYVSGIEIYKTKDKNIEKTSKNEEKEGFVLQNGEITEIAYYNEIVSDSYEEDYEDISTNASVNLISVDGTRFYKGKKLALKKAYNPSKWSDLKQVHLGFITEQSYSEDGVELKISGMSKLLDQEKQFTFTKTKISKVLKEIIESTGLKAKIDTTGLKDSKISYTNVSSSGSGGGSESSVTGGEGETVDSLVRKIVGNETNDLKKCKLVHGWLKENVRYHGHSCTWYHTPEACLKHKHSLNCADTALLTRSMMSSAGLDAWVVHRSSNNGHFWTLIKIDGKIYASDQTGSGSPFNTIWYKHGDRRECDSRGGNWDVKNGKKPDC